MVERGGVGVSCCILQRHKMTRPRLEPAPFDLESVKKELPEMVFFFLRLSIYLWRRIHKVKLEQILNT